MTRSAAVTSCTVPRTKAVSFSNVTLMSSLGKIARDLLPGGVELVVAHPDREVVDQPRAVLLPDDQGRLARRFAVDQDFFGIDRDRLRQIAIGDRKAADVERAVDDQRLADGDDQLCACVPAPVAGALPRCPGRRACAALLGCRRHDRFGAVRRPKHNSEPQAAIASTIRISRSLATYLPSPLAMNFCSAFFVPEMISIDEWLFLLRRRRAPQHRQRRGPAAARRAARAASPARLPRRPSACRR